MSYNGNLDPIQIIQAAWDSANQVLRTSAVVDVSGGITVAIDHLDDSIAIGDGGGSARKAGVNTDLELIVYDSKVKAAVDLVKTAVDNTKTSVDAVKTSVDANNTELVAIKNRQLELAAGLVPNKFDNIDVSARDSAGRVTQILYKLSSTTVATLNITYDGNGFIDTVSKV